MKISPRKPPKTMLEIYVTKMSQKVCPGTPPGSQMVSQIHPKSSLRCPRWAQRAPKMVPWGPLGSQVLPRLPKYLQNDIKFHPRLPPRPVSCSQQLASEPKIIRIEPMRQLKSPQAHQLPVSDRQAASQPLSHLDR